MNIKNINPIIDELASQLTKATDRLKKSYDKVVKLDLISEKTSDDELETWDSFAARFARVSDIFLTKFLRAKIYKLDPAFKGPLIDILNFSAKNNLLSSPERWLAIRELRNKEAHEYNEQSLAKFYESLINEVPFILTEVEKILTDKK